MQKCPKSDRCKFGGNCPREHFPSVGYLCFDSAARKQFLNAVEDEYRPRGRRKICRKISKGGL